MEKRTHPRGIAANRSVEEREFRGPHLSEPIVGLRHPTIVPGLSFTRLLPLFDVDQPPGE